MTTIELAVQDAAGVRIAADVGAARVELCSGLGLGGLTPSLAVVEYAVEVGRSARVENPVGAHVLIRPRGGDFVFTDDEVRVMIRDIEHYVSAGVAGVVVGALTRAGRPDLDVLGQLVEAAGEVEVTFHRAVDVAADPLATVGALVGRGVTRILTSGGAPTAATGAHTLAEMVHHYGAELEIMAGSGINPANVRDVVATGVGAVHFSAKRTIAGSGLALGAADTGSYDVTDPELAREIVAALAG